MPLELRVARLVRRGEGVTTDTPRVEHAAWALTASAHRSQNVNPVVGRNAYTAVNRLPPPGDPESNRFCTITIPHLSARIELLQDDNDPGAER